MLKDLPYTILSAASAVTAIVDTRISPAPLPPDVEGPCVTFEIRGPLGESLLGLSGPLTAQVRCICWSQSYDTSRTLADAVRSAMTAAVGTYGTSEVCVIEHADNSEDWTLPDDSSELGWFSEIEDYTVYFSGT